ncbi:MAG TPA: tRNA guanosine(34) transglycosylase Tgt [Thermomicrobiales bacterium]|nr:tRNA guanosine(34) transglycosylase Tgt [Thermomicrobiales bacterium]
MARPPATGPPRWTRRWSGCGSAAPRRVMRVVPERSISSDAPPEALQGVQSTSAGNASPVTFELLTTDAPTRARRGRMRTAHGAVETPAFMPVGTQATVKTLHPDEVRATGAQIILANTYHLMLRPGVETIERAGGLHRFMGWNGPILTDSGGFQIFSLGGNAQLTEERVAFRSHIDGSRHELTPERSMRLQLRYGSDIVMALDTFVGLPAERAAVQAATERTARWLQRCVAAFASLGGHQRGSALFGICQGGMDADLRRESAAMLAAADVSGCAIGGLSVGEPKPVMAAMLEETTDRLPAGKPRYLMGVGSPEDLWMGVGLGVDLFDCVLPTRLARNGALFTPTGRVNIKQRRWAEVHKPLDPTCDCEACGRFTAAYLHHLFRADEILGLRLASAHNLRFLARQMEEIRAAIETGTFAEAAAAFHARYRPVGAESAA